MAFISKSDYAVLDRREVSMFLFHPRAGLKMSERDIFIPVEDRILVGARFHTVRKDAPGILFFHGNGEIAADYDDIAKMYNKMGINFLIADYRGYGRSTGKPTVSAMMQDCHLIFNFTKNWLKENGYSGPFILMGRSLGSASVLELAACYKDQADALIVESGFAYAGPLLELIGINIRELGFREEEGFRNTDKIRKFDKPALVIHAQYDQIIPFADGKALYDACGSADKTLLMIPEADHNDIFFKGLSQYMAAIKTLVEKLGKEKE